MNFVDHVGFWCCKSGPINFCVSLPRTGFVPGEKIPINATIDNKSNFNINRTKAFIKQVCMIIF